MNDYTVVDIPAETGDAVRVKLTTPGGDIELCIMQANLISVYVGKAATNERMGEAYTVTIRGRVYQISGSMSLHAPEWVDVDPNGAANGEHPWDHHFHISREDSASYDGGLTDHQRMFIHDMLRAIAVDYITKHPDTVAYAEMMHQRTLQAAASSNRDKALAIYTASKRAHEAAGEAYYRALDAMNHATKTTPIREYGQS